MWLVNQEENQKDTTNPADGGEKKEVKKKTDKKKKKKTAKTGKPKRKAKASSQHSRIFGVKRGRAVVLPCRSVTSFGLR